MSDLNTSTDLPRVNVGTAPDGYANVRAQESRDLADRLGLTADIEREFAKGASVSEVTSALEQQLSTIDAADRAAFLVGVRGTLGIPANFGMAGETEFAQWKAARDDRVREVEARSDDPSEPVIRQPSLPERDTQSDPLAAGDLRQPATVLPAEPVVGEGESYVEHVNAIAAGVDPELVDAGEHVAQALGFSNDDVAKQLDSVRGDASSAEKPGPSAASDAQPTATTKAGKKARAVLTKSGYDIPKGVLALYVAKDGAFVDRKTEAIAFEDSGRKLSTKADDRKTIESMVEVAEAKNWGTLHVTGTQEFRRQAWIAAQVAGLEVVGYEPSPQDKAAVEARREEMRIGGGERAQEQQPANSLSPDGERDKGSPAIASEAKPESTRLLDKQQLAVDTIASILSQRGLEPEEVAKAVDAATARFVENRVHVGRVIEHGAAPYEHNPENSRSYFVTLATANGQETIWGVDLQRSAEAGKFADGIEVMLAYQGRTEVTVPTRERDGAGKLTGHMIETTTHRNEWDVTSIEQLQAVATGKVQVQDNAQQANAPQASPEAEAHVRPITPAELEELRNDLDQWRKDQAMEQAREVIERHSTPAKRHDAARDLLRSLGRDPAEFFDENGKPRDEKSSSAADPTKPEVAQERQESAKEAAARMVLEHEMNNAGIPEAQRQQMRDELTATIAHAHENGIELAIPEPVLMERSASIDQGLQAGVAHHQQIPQTPTLDVDL